MSSWVGDVEFVFFPRSPTGAFRLGLFFDDAFFIFLVLMDGTQGGSRSVNSYFVVLSVLRGGWGMASTMLRLVSV